MLQFNFPTKMYYGDGAILALADTIAESTHQNFLIVTDKTLVEVGIYEQVLLLLENSQKKFTQFDQTHPNPIEEDVLAGVKVYQENECDAIIALGGGSPMDAAKAIKVMVAHPAPLAQYDDAIGGDAKIVNPMPPLYAIPTTAGTGSEVGRSGVITINGKKTIIFAPELLPNIAVLDPIVTTKLPPHITAATGIDAFVHALEGYLAPMFHPMADGIAIEGMKLVLEYLPKAFKDGEDLDARAKMLVAASMGATAFQKGLGMVHSLAHPLSARFNTHHGLANAILLPNVMTYLQDKLNDEQLDRFNTVRDLLNLAGFQGETLGEACRDFVRYFGIEFGLLNHQIPKESIEQLSQDAIEDPCHPTNIVPVSLEDMKAVYQMSLES